MSDEQGSMKKLDKKSMGIGLGAATVVLTLLQGQGITFMNAGQEAKNAEVMQRVVKAEIKDMTQDDKIRKIEGHLGDIEIQIREGFKESRNDLKSEIKSLSDIVRDASNDRWTRTDNIGFSSEVDRRFRRSEEAIKELQKAVNQKGE